VDASNGNSYSGATRCQEWFKHPTPLQSRVGARMNLYFRSSVECQSMIISMTDDQVPSSHARTENLKILNTPPAVVEYSRAPPSGTVALYIPAYNFRVLFIRIRNHQHTKLICLPCSQRCTYLLGTHYKL